MSLQEYIRKQKAELKPAQPIPEQPENGAFADRQQTASPAKRGLKLNNNKSAIKAIPIKTEDFRAQINEILANEKLQKEMAYALVSRFQAALRDKVLDSSKNSTIRNEELSIINDLIDFARIVNSDDSNDTEDSYHEDIGTISIIVTLCRSLFIQRDRINELEFLASKTSKQIAALEQKVELLARNPK